MYDHRPERYQPIAFNMMATFEPALGWSLLVHLVTPGEDGPISDRVMYQGLANDELIDVIEATAHRRLRSV